MQRSSGIGTVSELLSIAFFRYRWSGYALVAFPAIFLVLFFIPHVRMFRMSFWRVSGTTLVPDFTFYNYAYLLSEKFYLSALWETVVLSLAVSGICLVVGYPVAVILTRTRMRFRTLIAFILFTPMFVSVVIRSFGWLVLLERQGVLNSLLISAGLIDEPMQLLNNFTGVAIGMVNVLLVFMIIPLASSLSGIAPSLEEAAQTLGANRLRVWWHVTWPLSSTGVITGVVLVFVITLSSYVLPRLLGGPTYFIYPTQMWRQVMSVLNWPLGAAMGVVLIAVAMVVSALVSLCAYMVFPYYRQVRQYRKRV